MKKAVNPKTNCFVYMDMRLSNWEFLFKLLYKIFTYIIKYFIF